jgi:hypothetical protein
MSDLKFSCPSCGQHIQCEESHAGEKIPCPGCALLIRVPTDAQIVRNTSAPATTPPPTAVAPGMAIIPTLEENFLAESGTPLPTTPPVTEREQEIAAARAAHPVLPSSQVKPRLSFILSGGAAPAPQENESASHSVEPKHSENPSPEAHSHHE